MTDKCCQTQSATETATSPALAIAGLAVRTGSRLIVRNATFQVAAHSVLGIIGPSGAGKSTLLRALNRLTDLTPALRVTGEVRLRGESIFGRAVDPDALRTRIGMLFQQPVIFPRSILANVLFGVLHVRRLARRLHLEVAERALREAALWDEVKDRLHESAGTLSVGQQQRLCLARTLAGEPEVILMDEPTSALDPRSTQAIEELILRLKERHTLIVVTHNVAQARRITDWIACMCMRDGAGEIVETACCDALLDNPQCREAIDFLSGDIGLEGSTAP